MIIETRENGIIDLSDIKSVGRQFMMNTKKFVIYFSSKTGGVNGWTFDDEKQRDTVYETIKAKMGAVNVDAVVDSITVV